MQIFRRRLRSLTFIALFAMFGLALAPTVSHALSRLGGQGGFNPWAELCSTVGASVSTVAAASVASPIATDSPAAPAAPSKAGSAHLEHCPLCGTLGHAPALPMTHAARLPAAAGAHFLPALFDHAPRPLFAWAAAQPRGPPAAA